jgi:hypothetical protein
VRVGGAAAREKRRGKVRKSGTKRPQSGGFVTDDTYLTACSRFRESARLGKAVVEVEGVSGMCSWEFGGSRRRARGARGDHRFFLSYTVWAARPRGRASLVTQYGFLSYTRSSERASLVTHSRGHSEVGARLIDDASGDSPPPFTGTGKQARLSRVGGQGPRNQRFARELGTSCLEARYAARMECPATPASGSAIGSLYDVNRSAGRLAYERE